MSNSISKVYKITSLICSFSVKFLQKPPMRQFCVIFVSPSQSRVAEHCGKQQLNFIRCTILCLSDRSLYQLVLCSHHAASSACQYFEKLIISNCCKELELKKITVVFHHGFHLPLHQRISRNNDDLNAYD